MNVENKRRRSRWWRLSPNGAGNQHIQIVDGLAAQTGVIRSMENFNDA